MNHILYAKCLPIFLVKVETQRY